MPRTRIPLFVKIVAWFLLNVAVLAAVGWLIAEQQLRFGLDSLLAGRAGDRLRSLADVITQELSEAPPEQWSAVLSKWERAYPIHLELFAGGMPVAARMADVTTHGRPI